MLLTWKGTGTRMPVETWTQTEFDRFYRTRITDPAHPQRGVWFHYSRIGLGRGFGDFRTDELELFKWRWARLTRLHGIARGDRVLVVGCAFGFLIEAAKAAGFQNVYGIDSSAWIASMMPTEADPESVVVARDFRHARAPDELISATGSRNFVWVVTEDVVSCYDDVDVVAMAPVLEGFLDSRDVSRVVHMTTIGEPGSGDPDINWKATIDEWAALLPAHSWMTPQGAVPA